MSTTMPIITLRLLVDTKAKGYCLPKPETTLSTSSSHSCLCLSVQSSGFSPFDRVGSPGSLYQIFENLHDTCIQLEAKKEAYSAQVIEFGNTVKLLSLPGNADQAILICLACCDYVTSDCESKCPSCKEMMDFPLRFLKQTAEASSSSYMITDDLEVKPMSAILGIALRNKYNVKMNYFHEMVVSLAMNEAREFILFALFD